MKIENSQSVGLMKFEGNYVQESRSRADHVHAAIITQLHRVGVIYVRMTDNLQHNAQHTGCHRKQIDHLYYCCQAYFLLEKRKLGMTEKMEAR